MKSKLVVLAGFFVATFAASNAFAVLDFLHNKQAPKKTSRWTLADWMSTKRQMSLQDQWLAMNSSDNFYEFILGGAHQDFDESLDSMAEDVERTAQRYQLTAFTTIAGLHGELYQSSGSLEHKTGLFLLRLLGTSQQNTNLTLGYGLRSTEVELSAQGYEFENTVGYGSLTMYVTSKFGLKGDYYHLFESEVDGVKLSGHESRAGVFLEFEFLRITGNLIQSEFEYSGLVTESQVGEGFEVMLSIYF